MAITKLDDNTTELQEEIAGVLLPESAKTTTGALRQSYAENMLKAPFNDEAREKEITDCELNQPIFEDMTFYDDDLPDRRKLLRSAMDVSMDIATLDNSIINATDTYARLIASTISRLNTVKTRLQQNEQRREDIQFMSNAYKGISNVIPITDQNMTGTFCYKNGTFMAAQTFARQTLFTVESISGNGYSGNAYVVKDGNFADAYDDRSNKEYISDDSMLTTYEYSRLCSRSEKYYYNASADPAADTHEPQEVNHDNKDAVCVLQLEPQIKNGGVNMLVIDTDDKSMKILDVQISNDGKKYHSALTNEISLSDDMYHAMNYIPGSNIVCFPETQHLKLVLSSSRMIPGEELATEKTELIDGVPVTTTYPLKNVVRKVIAINGIRLYACRYTQSSMHTPNLCPENGCNRVAVFCNEYVPEDARGNSAKKGNKPVTYTLYINGQPYEVRPINSDEDGTKIISCKQGTYTESGVLFLSEPIKTIQLQVESTMTVEQRRHSSAT